MTIDATDVVSQYGDYYANEGNMDRLVGELHLKTNTAEAANTAIVEETYLKNVGVTLSEIIQSYQDTFTSKGTLDFNPLPIQLYNLKVDLSVNPDRLKATYLGFLTSIADADRSNWPFVRWFMEMHVAKRSRDDRERKAYGKGVYAAPTSGTAGSAAASMDGIIKLAEVALANGGTELTLNAGDFAAANAFESYEEWQDQLPSEFEGEEVLYLSPVKYVRDYFRDDRATNGANQNYNGANPMIQFSDVLGMGGHSLNPLQSLDGSDTVIVTPKANFYHFRRAGYNKPFKVETYKREVAIFNDWYEGFGFINPKHVFMYKKGGVGSGSGSGA